MRISKLATVFMISVHLIVVSTVFAEVDEKSIFESARRPASELDITLFNIQLKWRELLTKFPDSYAKKRFPLITKARIFIDLDYYRGDNHITAYARITNLDGFLGFTPQERKHLVKSVLERIKGFLEMPVSVIGSLLENQHIRLTVNVDPSYSGDNSIEIPGFIKLPLNLGYGHAGYADGQYVYNESYFLNLQIRNGVVVSGDSARFIIESE